MATKTKNQTVTIKRDEENPEPVEIIADAIIKISDSFEKIKNSRLKQRVVVLLIKDKAPGIPVRDIETVLDIVPRLKEIYLNKTHGKSNNGKAFQRFSRDVAGKSRRWSSRARIAHRILFGNNQHPAGRRYRHHKL